MTRARAALAWALPSLALMLTCGRLGLIEPTETRYAEIAREMLAGDWLIPHLNGIPHFHKPPLSYWIGAAGMAAFGRNEFAVRLGAALAAGLILWCTARMAALRDGARGQILAPLLLASTALFFILSHQLASDIFLTAAVAGFYAAYLDPRTRRSLWPFVALAAGFMAKGPVVFILTIAPVLLASLWARDGAASRPLARVGGWIVFALLALPWYLFVLLQTRGLFTFFMRSQIWERYTTTVHQRGGPIYYFVLVILAGGLPWVVASLRGARAAAERRPGFERALLVTWIALPLLFFSFSGSKLPAYVLPVFPALALLAASELESPARGTTIATTAILFLLAAAVEIGAFLSQRVAPQPLGFWMAAHVATFFLAAAGVDAWRGGWVRSGALVFAALVVLLWTLRPLDLRLGSPRSLARILNEARRPGEPVVEYGAFNAGIPFYLGTTVPMVDVPRDLDLVDSAMRSRVLVASGELPRMTAARGRVWVVGEPGDVSRLGNALGLKAAHVAGWGKQSLNLLERAQVEPMSPTHR